jgi:HPt (histidine-containing phosphotransfer) domain-containing protein
MAALLGELRAPGAAPYEPGKLVQAAHALAGSAGMFGFERLVLVARHFERTVKADPSQAAALAADLGAVLDLSLAALRARLGEVEHAEAA